jgi:hypothetical protein
MWKNIVDSSRPQTAIWSMRFPCWIPKCTNTNTQNMYDTYRLSTATMVARMRLNVTLHVHCLACLFDTWDGEYYAMWRRAQKSTCLHVKITSVLLFSDSRYHRKLESDNYFLEFFNIKVNENLFTSQSSTCIQVGRRMVGRKG